MSYDITLVRAERGEDPAAAYGRYIRRHEVESSNLEAFAHSQLPASVRLEMQRLADLLKARHPAFSQFKPERPLPWIELNEEALMVQVTIGEYSVEITTPYFREDASGVLACIRTCVEILNDAAGFLAYDPQLDRFAGPGDFDAMDAQYHSVDAYFPEVIASRDGRQKPWWKFW